MGFGLGDFAKDAFNKAKDTVQDAAGWAADNVGSGGLNPVASTPFGLGIQAAQAFGPTLQAAANQVGAPSGGEGRNWGDAISNSPWLNPNSDSVVVNLVRAGSGQLPSAAFVDRVRRDGPGEIRDLADSADQINRFLNPVADLPRSAFEVLTADDKGAALQDQIDRRIDNTLSFGGGLLDWGKGAGELLVGATALSNPAMAFALERTTGVNVYEEVGNAAEGLAYGAISDPDAVANGVVGYDKLTDDPIRWLGEQAPDIALEIATAGLGVVGKADDIAGAGIDANRAIPDTPNLPDRPSTPDAPEAPRDIDAPDAPNNDAPPIDPPNTDGTPARPDGADTPPPADPPKPTDLIAPDKPYTRADFDDYVARTEANGGTAGTPEDFVALEDAAKADALAFEQLDGGHVIGRHGPELSDAQLEARVTQAQTPNGPLKEKAERYSTQFNSYDELVRTRDAGVDALLEKYPDLDLTKPPVDGQPTSYPPVRIDHGRAIDDGFVGVGSRSPLDGVTIEKKGETKQVKAFTETEQISGITDTNTAVFWDADNGVWQTQHYPIGKGWNQATQSYD